MASTSTDSDIIARGAQEIGVTPETFARMYQERPKREQNLDQFYHHVTMSPAKLSAWFRSKSYHQDTTLSKFRGAVYQLRDYLTTVKSMVPMEEIRSVYPSLTDDAQRFLNQVEGFIDQAATMRSDLRHQLESARADTWYQHVAEELNRYHRLKQNVKRTSGFKVIDFPSLRTEDRVPSYGGFFHFLNCYDDNKIQYPLTLTDYQQALIQRYPKYLAYLDQHGQQRHLVVPAERFTQIVNIILPTLRVHDILDVDGYRDNGFYYVFERDGERWIIPTPGDYCLPKEALPMLHQFQVRYREDLGSLYGSKGPIEVMGFKLTDDDSSENRYIQLASSSDDMAVEVALGDYHFFVESGMEDDLPEGVTVVY
jgi:hypothetical protein